MSSPLLQRSPSPFSIQGSAPASLPLTEQTSLPPGTSNDVSLELPEPNLQAAMFLETACKSSVLAYMAEGYKNPSHTGNEPKKALFIDEI